ncbi:MAG: hypothetical protein DRI34_09185 [Deltaproteobacteria bacterium]|nr:MAG: hypothetical protein DRI34_09185 [Deltaproteobacteria bacterium]
MSVLVTAVPAWAGCPSASGCLMAKYVEYDLQPPQPCLVMHVGEEDCQCMVWISMENNCQVPLDPQDFYFSECNVGGQYYTGTCPAQVGPGDWGNLYLPPSGVTQPGHHQQEFHLELGGQEHVLGVSFDLVEVNTGCSCNTGTGTSGWPVLLLLTLVLVGCRRSAHRHTHRG